MIEQSAAIQESLKSLNFIKKTKGAVDMLDETCASYIVQRANVCKVHSTASKCVQGTQYSEQIADG